MGAIDSLARTQSEPLEAEVSTAMPLVSTDPSGLIQGGALAQLHYFSKTADVLGECNLLPRHIKTKGDCVAIMMAGAELGLPPMKAIRGLMMIDGKIELSADVMLALVKQHGYKVRWPETSDRVATLVLIDPKDPEYEHKQSFSMEEAAKAGLATKDNWRKYPAAMLRARVISASVRAFCPEVLAGSYHEGEISGAVSGGAEAPVMSTRDDVETRGAISLAEMNAQAAEASGDTERIESARAKYEEAVQDRLDAQSSAVQDEEQIAENRLVEGWEAVLGVEVLSENDLKEWCYEEGGRYRVLIFHKERARAAIKACTMAINAVEERTKGKDWITLSAVKEWLDASPEVDEDEPEPE